MDQRSDISIGDGKGKEAQRGYGCPCGKTYLSYPALFTHVKQKHQGKAPGKLIKPKSGKIRGRPKTRLNVQRVFIQPEDTELSAILARIEQDVPLLLAQCQIDIEAEFQKSEGNSTCQDAASLFLDHFQDLDEKGIAVLSCFLNRVKLEVQKTYGMQYWEKEKPSQIISIANHLYIEHENDSGLGKQTVKQLLYNFFQWLFANKLTDHRLLRRRLSQQQPLKTNEQS